ncbi:hypothetical protein BDV96DRAFT_691242 [Lophiotrema nucula]|uniref:Actin-like ATPase domain-containing protein n=1 Tax=Lophiotrema nucula TaxID=690887 RepID=A0A6A5YWH4_9PLEO|nr:hypothetical protein BDV96DRAFT_691242 [Lophiotrema nucula]
MAPCVYIGIDFGTTFSGAAWALSSRPEDIKIVTRWRSNHSFNTDDAKAPTQLVYAPQNRYDSHSSMSYGFSSGRKVASWGYEIDTKQEPLKWFKLCLEQKAKLHPDVQKSPQLATAESMLSREGVTPVDAAADYLRQLWESIVEDLERQCGATAVKGLPFRVILTVPAMWSDSAQNNTRQAAQKAGILQSRLCGETTLDLVPEPEAAALATLAEFNDRPGVQRGDVITVCDCGGGTVDITSYTIQNINPMFVKEAVNGDGKMCGSIFVDEQFQTFLRGRLKRWDKLNSEQVKRVMDHEWEYGIKRRFSGEDGTFEVELPAEATGSVFSRKASRLKLDKRGVQSIFDPVLGRVRQLIGNQVKQVQEKYGKPPKYIMLVGGFGACRYLHHVVEKEFSRQGIEVLQTTGNANYGPWTAICRGAVIKAMSGGGFEGPSKVKVTTRVAKRNYGLTAAQRFVDGFHLPIDKVWSNPEDCYFANNQMRWCLKKGVDVATQHPVILSFYRLVQQPWELGGGQLTCDIWISEATTPENRKTMDVTKLCDIKVRIDTPFERLPPHLNKAGQMFRRISYDIEMTCSGAELKFAAIINGTRQDAQNVEALFS